MITTVVCSGISAFVAFAVGWRMGVEAQYDMDHNYTLVRVDADDGS